MIEAIYIAPEAQSPQIQQQTVEVRANLGIVGDRNFGKDTYPGQNITFVEKEEIDAFNARYNQSIGLETTRRNIITTGVRLNQLVGKEFSIGGVIFAGIELCEPCKVFGENLANPSMSPAAVVKAFIARGGLRATVLSDGVIRAGMAIQPQGM